MGYRYQGELSVPNPAINLFSVSVTVSSYGPSDGTDRGYGAQIDYKNLEDRRAIRLVGTDGRYAGVFDLCW